MILTFISHFNSIKVRLERDNPWIGMLMKSIFQFHKGTIRTFQAPLYNSKGLISIP